jgi:hypothetical protein
VNVGVLVGKPVDPVCGKAVELFCALSWRDTEIGLIDVGAVPAATETEPGSDRTGLKKGG